MSGVLDIIAIKTTIGEEIVSKVKEDNDDHYILEDPRALMMQQLADGQVQINMVPFMVCAADPENKTESTIKYYKKDIMAEVVNISQQLDKQYRQNTSGIALV